MTLLQLADAIDSVVSTVSRYENGTRIPERDTMKKIYIVSRGAVTPDSFYDIPAWEAELIRREAEAELARKAA
jgi:transcriptional regulator with XRE-family HTH domain